MEKLDDRIAKALAEEDRAGMQALEERAFVVEALGLFEGRNAWIAVVTMVAQVAMFAVAVWCGWQFFAATEVLAALKWGLSAATLMILSAVVKMALLPMMQTNRILRALRGLERALT